MEAHELAEKFRNNTKTEASYQEIVEWCGKNASSLDLSNQDQQYLYEMSTRYLMKIKIGQWNEADANLIINYLARTLANDYGIEKDLVITVLQDPEYREKFKDNSNAMCSRRDDGKSEVVYSSRVVDNLRSKDTLRFIRGLQTVFHEVVHAKQYNELYAPENDGEQLKYDGNTYKMALEAMTRNYYPKFYKENYMNMNREYEAEYLGLQKAMEVLQRYYKQELFKDLGKEEFDEILKEMITLDGMGTYEKTGELKLGEGTYKAPIMLDVATEQYIKENPEAINKVPVLKFAYNPDGSKKNIIQLIQDRAALIRDNPEIDLQRVDDLYKTIANYKAITNAEMLELYGYITDEAIEDEFAYDLLQYRLERTDWTQEKISEFMEETRQDVAKIRQERGELELRQEQEESIKDEVGDELRPQTETEKQEEQQVETMWQNHFQSWDRNALELPNCAKRKEDAVRVMQDVERQKTQQEKQQEQQEQDDGTNR